MKKQFTNFSFLFLLISSSSCETFPRRVFLRRVSLCFVIPNSTYSTLKFQCNTASTYLLNDEHLFKLHP